MMLNDTSSQHCFNIFSIILARAATVHYQTVGSCEPLSDRDSRRYRTVAVSAIGPRGHGAMGPPPPPPLSVRGPPLTGRQHGASRRLYGLLYCCSTITRMSDMYELSAVFIIHYIFIYFQRERGLIT